MGCSYQTGQTPAMHTGRTDAASAAGKDGSAMETSAVHCSARDASAVASPGLQALLEVQVEGSFSQTKDIPGDCSLDQGDGKGQPTLGSRTNPGRIAQAG